MTYPEYETFSRDALDYLKARIAQAKAQFGIGGLSRYEYDLYRSELWWSEVDAPRVRGRITVVGSISTQSNTWLWSWANPHFSDINLGDIDQVRAFGEAEGITKLTEAKWAADEVDGWEMAAIAARLLEAQGAYRSPNENGFLFLLYDGLEPIPAAEVERYMPLKRPATEESPPPLNRPASLPRSDDKSKSAGFKKSILIMILLIVAVFVALNLLSPGSGGGR